jgi:thiol:disulfide interchange protein DsbD
MSGTMKAKKIAIIALPRFWLLLLSTAMIFLAGWISSAQPKVLQTKLFLSRQAVHAGENIALALKLEIAPNWHINAPGLTDEFLIPCSLEVSDTANYHVLEYYYPPPEKGKFPFSEQELTFFAGETILGALLEIPATVSPGKIKIQASFTYQACDDRSCLPPETRPLEAEIEVVPPDQPTEELNPEIFSQLKFSRTKK